MSEQPRRKRNIVPGKGDIYTFAECPDRWWEQEQSIIHRQTLHSCQRWYLDTGCIFICERCVSEGKCPLGYAR